MVGVLGMHSTRSTFSCRTHGLCRDMEPEFVELTRLPKVRRLDREKSIIRSLG